MSLLVMAALTILIGMGLRWREERMASAEPVAKAHAPRLARHPEARGEPLGHGRGAGGLATIVLLGGLHWARQISGGW
jgi:hypothetical protein